MSNLAKTLETIYFLQSLYTHVDINQVKTEEVPRSLESLQGLFPINPLFWGQPEFWILPLETSIKCFSSS